MAKQTSRTKKRGRGADRKPAKKRTRGKQRAKLIRHEPSERALLEMMDGASLKTAAQRHGISRYRLRRYLKEQTRAKYVGGGAWKIREKKPILLRAVEGGRLVNLYVDRRGRSTISDHWRGVGRYLRSNRPEDLAAIRSISVRDTRGKLHRLEDRPNVLRHLASADELSFLTIYADTPAGGVSP